MGEDRNRWLRGLPWLALAFVLAVVLLIAALEASDEQTSWWASSLTTVPAVALFGYVLSRTRTHLAAGELQRFRVRSFALFGAIAATAIGGGILAGGLGGRNVGFAALTIVVLGVSHLLSEFRNIETRRRGRALQLATLCLSLSLGGIYWQSSHPATGLLVAAVGAIFGYFALVTATEHMMAFWADEHSRQRTSVAVSDDRRLPPTYWWKRFWQATGPWPIGGIALLAGSALVFASNGATAWGIGTIIVLALLVLSTINRGDFDLILVVLAVGMWWAVSPTTAAPNEQLVPPQILAEASRTEASNAEASDTEASDTEASSDPGNGREGVLLVFGDSYISGEGASRYVAGTNERGKNECRRAETTHHHLLTQAARVADPETDTGSAEQADWFQQLTPDERARIETFPQRVISVACSGAVAANITALPQFAWQPPLSKGARTPQRSLTQIQLADEYLETTASYVDTIMISIGGNDALFSTTVTTCLGPGDCSEIGQYFIDQLDRLGSPEDATLVTEPTDEEGGADESATETEEPAIDIDGVPAETVVAPVDDSPTVLDVYEQIRDHPWPRNPDGDKPRILVIPYPEPLAQDSCIRMISQAEHLFINDFVRQLNGRLNELATAARLEFVHTTETALRNDSTGEESAQLCGGGDGWKTAFNRSGLNFLDFFPVGGSLTSRISPLSWVHNSVHPNELGHRLLANAILRYDGKSELLSGQMSSLEQRCVNPASHDAAESSVGQVVGAAADRVLPNCYTGQTCRNETVVLQEPPSAPLILEPEPTEAPQVGPSVTPAASPTPAPESAESPVESTETHGGADPADNAAAIAPVVVDPAVEIDVEGAGEEPRQREGTFRFCTDPCDDTLSERPNVRDARDDCPAIWSVGQLRTLAGSVYLPNLMAVLGAWMIGAWLMFRRERPKGDVGPDGGGQENDGPDTDGSPDAGPDEDPIGADDARSEILGFASATPSDGLSPAIVVAVVLVVALLVDGAPKTAVVLVAAALLFNFLFKILPQKLPPPAADREPELVLARAAKRRDPFEGEMRWWDRVLREFRYQIIGWVGVAAFVAVVLFRAQNNLVGGVAAGVALSAVIGAALFPMVMSRPRQRSTQFALLSAVVLLSFVSGFIWPIVVTASNEAENGTLARDLPLVAGGILAMALLVGSSIVDGAVRRQERESDEGSFLGGLIAGFASLSDKAASELHSAQGITGIGLLVAAVAAKQLDGAEAYAIFGLVVAGIILNWWALFMGHANRLWPFASIAVLAAIVSVELLWQGGWGYVGRIVVALVALHVVATAFSARTLRFTAVAIVLFFGIGVYTIGTSIDIEAGDAAPESFIDALRGGLKEVWRSIFTGLGVDDPPTPGPFAFVAVLTVFVLAYRSMEVTNSRRTLTPVTVEDFTAPESFKDTAALKSQLQSELARAGITDPPFVPAGGLPSQVITVFEGVDGSTWTKAAQALTNLSRPQRGTVVVPALEELSEDRAVVTVRVKHARTNRILYTASFHAEDPRTAVRKAVAFVAQNTLGASVTTPAWARWESDDGLALRYYLESRSSSHYGIAISREERIRKLVTAISASPSTGLTRVDLGHVQELERKPWIALRIHLEAAQQHPRLVAAHYRSATGLSMIAGELLRGSSKPESVTMNNRVMIVNSLTAVLDNHTNGDFDYLNTSLLLAEESTEQSRIDLAQALLEAADDIISGVLRITSTPVLLLNAVVHQDERAHWAALLRDVEAKRHETGRYLILRELIRIRLILSRAGEVGLKEHDREDRELTPAERAEVERWHRLVQTLLGDVERIAKDYGGPGSLYNHACLLAVYVCYVEENKSTFASLFESRLPAATNTNGDPADGDGRSLPSDPDVSSDVFEQAMEAELEPLRLKAIELLYAARAHPGTGFPALDWIERDPDLRGLQTHDLFLQLKDWMRRGEDAMALARNVHTLVNTNETASS